MNLWHLSTFILRFVVLLTVLSTWPLHSGASERPGAADFSSLPPAAQSRIYAIIGHAASGNQEKGLTKPWEQPATLTASDGGKRNELGYSVAISGNTVVVGAPYATVNSKYAQGAAYVFVKPASGWANLTEVAKLTATEVAEQAFFGSSVSISGDTVVVGADGVNVGAGQYQGAAYVFVKPAGGWTKKMTETAKLTAADGANYAYFGSSVTISDDTVIVGADGANIGSNKFQGAAYVFTKPATGWKSSSAFDAKLTASDGTRGSQLGYSIASSGTTVVAGARSAAIGANSRQGAVYVFVRPANGWATGKETAKLAASDGASDDQLGYSVSVNDDVVAAGATGSNSHGAAYVFVKPSGGWMKMTQTAKLTGSDGATGDELGYSVSVSGDTVVAGAFSPTIGSDDRPGAVYVFTRSAHGWANATQTAKLTPSGGSRDGLGSSVCTDGNAVVAGAVNAIVGQNQYQGVARIFENPAGLQP